MAKKRSKPSDAKLRIIETAERLFYAEGIRAVGIDRIIAEAEVAKMTLYNHFASKDDLILAVLQHRESQVDEMFERAIGRYIQKGLSHLDAFFATLKDWFKTPGFRGCSFINARVELADSDHPASQFAAQHKARFQQKISGILSEASGAEAARSLGPAVFLLVEGAIVTAVMEQSARPADVAHAAAIKLIANFT